MGQKVHPEAMRVGYIHDWKSNWFNEKNFSEYLDEDIKIRAHIVSKLAHAGLSDITIRKDAQELEVNIHTARPGIVIGKSGSEVDALRRDQSFRKGEDIVKLKVSAGDHLFVDRITYNFLPPKRGEIIVLDRKSVEGLPQDQFYIKRM